ncbi:hypothetical protein BIV57_10840 [Mangrovactinospora gilvigrisea]|uniref:ANTAR domain-containing protein n=1 Tax=Mangrovactinospora gilvigrisea TaxID=1428644 RepID=A0A1J7BVF1_9ACTN|nr:ANTAR domain-containing protein [Mangrovactinospora gilvigrisea]OIV37457.1 hypothetical protein BIV57_10840 [Mangrovactinospora gilvigrisea]
MGMPDRDPELAADHLARTVLDLARPADDPSAVLQRTCHLLTRQLQTSAALGYQAGLRQQLTGPVATEPRALELARAAVAGAPGPAADCLRSGRRQPWIPLTHPIARLRWPSWAAQARAAGYAQVCALPLTGGEDVVAAVTLLRTAGRIGGRPRSAAAAKPEHAPQTRGVVPGVDEAAWRRAELIAAAAATGLLAGRRLAEAHATIVQLEGALTSRILIEQAKGVLAERHRLTTGEAFTLLRRYARDRRIALRDLALQILDPQGPPRAHAIAPEP